MPALYFFALTDYRMLCEMMRLKIIYSATELETDCNRLVDEAKKMGEKDNISLILARRSEGGNEAKS
jgi:serine/threonine protein phosphatase PrpC